MKIPAKTLLLLVFALQGSAFAVTPDSQAIPFFRNLQTSFPSGQAPRQELENRLKSQEFHHTLKVSWNKKNFTLEGEQVLQEINCSKFAVLKQNSPVYEIAQSSATTLGLLSKDQEVEILEIQGYWAKIQEPFRKTIGWMPQNQLQPKKEDAGVFVNLIDTFLRKKPTHESTIVTTIPKAQRLKIVGYDNGFLKTRFLQYEGYVDLSHLVSRADFAVLAFKEGQWLKAHHRENQFLVTSDEKKIPLEEITAFSGDLNKGVVTNSFDEQPPVRAHVQILENEAHQWALSLLPGHGLVWWKKDSVHDTQKAIASELFLTTDEILKKEIFSMALEGSKKVKGLLSAQGIYKTENGLKWTYLKQFGVQDLPVAVHPDGVWFVGSYKSLDRGQSFEPFIRWDQLAGLIESHLGRHPKHIRLQKFESMPKGYLQVLVDTGPGRVTLRYNIPTSSWSVVK